MDSASGTHPVITVAAALIVHPDGRILLVRKRGTTKWMQAGGKPESGETATQTIVRELAEELELSVGPGDLEPLGRFATTAANEPGHGLLADVFRVVTDAPVRASAEIAEAVWRTVEETKTMPLAPLAIDLLEFVEARRSSSGADPGSASPLPAPLSRGRYGRAVDLSFQDLLGRASTRPLTEPEWDIARSPDAPLPLLEEWLTAAIDDRLPAANTATLATASAKGVPSARTVLLSDVTDDGVWFATSAVGPAGRDLLENPVAEVVLYFREHARQMRISGAVERGDGVRSAAAFSRRGERARAVTLASTQSATVPAEAEQMIAAAAERLEREADLVDPDWAAFRIRPDTVEFWQSRHATGECRLRYARDGDAWSRHELWP